MYYEINILINGSRCKQYTHNGKVFIQANNGSEYTIEIKNNTFERVLAVTSVDGLDCLTGKKADENGNGYVINGYNSLKLDGFRVSDEKVAKFIFSEKSESYAASKGDGSEENVGVIGIRIFEEKIKPPLINEIHHYHPHVYPWVYPQSPPCPKYPYDPVITWGGTSVGDSSINHTETYCCNDIPKNTNDSNLKGRITSQNLSSNNNDILRGFDTGTKFGDAKESKVIEVEFEKGILALSTNIYYASRKSLIEMGIPMENKKQVSFPEPFKGGKYAIPPKGWKG